MPPRRERCISQTADEVATIDELRRVNAVLQRQVEYLTERLDSLVPPLQDEDDGDTVTNENPFSVPPESIP